MLSLRERSKQRNREAIQSAAFALFQSHGFDQTTMEIIAQLAGVSRTTLFSYFPTKDSLLMRFAEHILEEQVVPSIVAYLRTTPRVVEVLRVLFMSIYEHILTDSSMGQSIKHELFLRPRAYAHEAGRASNSLLMTILRYGVAQGEIDTTVSLDHQAHYIAALYVAMYYRLTFPLSLTSYQQEIEPLLTFMAKGMGFNPAV